MAHVHLADAPRLVGRRPGDLDALFDAVAMDGIDVIDPDRHPHAFVLVIVDSERRGHVALAAPALAVLTEEDLAVAGADAAERRRIAPIPTLLPAEALEPFETLDDVGDVEDRRDAVSDHGVILSAISRCEWRDADRRFSLRRL